MPNVAAVTGPKVKAAPAARPTVSISPPDPDRLQRLLVRLERPLIDAAVRARLLRLLQFYDEGHIVLLIATITESEGNENALVEPVVSAVSNVINQHPEWVARGGQWLEAFDQIPLMEMLQAMRALDLFRERTIGNYYAMALRNKLARVFAEMDAPPAPPQPNRTSAARRAIEQGLELLKVKGPHSTSPITRAAADRFGLHPNECGQVLSAARLYGDRIWLVEKLSRDALFTLSAPSTPLAVRDAVERRLRAGETIRAPEIQRLRRGI
ncbi:hypothetical protein AB8B02_05795 [Tardiphaga sp. 862_B3_N4_1]|uniref:hypothetical protein n=1 Tax=Tardiphaga sp. 862_B3_N4_1 TaxID=3240764 RepID=UPI003F22D942